MRAKSKVAAQPQSKCVASARRSGVALRRGVKGAVGSVRYGALTAVAVCSAFVAGALGR